MKTKKCLENQFDFVIKKTQNTKKRNQIESFLFESIQLKKPSIFFASILNKYFSTNNFDFLFNILKKKKTDRF